MKEFDFEKRNAIWKEAYTYIAGQCYDFTFPVIYEFTAWHPWIQGYDGQADVCNKSEGHVEARIWVDESLK